MLTYWITTDWLLLIVKCALVDVFPTGTPCDIYFSFKAGRRGKRFYANPPLPHFDYSKLTYAGANDLVTATVSKALPRTLFASAFHTTLGMEVLAVIA